MLPKRYVSNDIAWLRAACIKARATASPPLKNTIERASVAYFSLTTTHHNKIAVAKRTAKAPANGKKSKTAAKPTPAKAIWANISEATDCLLDTTMGPSNPVRIAVPVPAKNAYCTNVKVNISIILYITIFF